MVRLLLVYCSSLIPQMAFLMAFPLVVFPSPAAPWLAPSHDLDTLKCFFLSCPDSHPPDFPESLPSEHLPPRLYLVCLLIAHHRPTKGKAPGPSSPLIPSACSTA